jgi:hypothetical protein
LDAPQHFRIKGSTRVTVMFSAVDEFYELLHDDAEKAATRHGARLLRPLPPMSVREIPAREWPAFLDKLGREHRAWLATVDRGGRVEAREQPLESIAANGGIDIRIGRKVIHVDAPQAVRIEETAEGATEALQVDDATGGRLTLRFRVALAPGALDGIAPAER